MHEVPPQHMKRDQLTIVGICLVLVLGLYVGAYFFCVQAPKPWPPIPMPAYARAVRMGPSYNFGARSLTSPVIQELFAPIHSLDSKLRPDRWTGWCVRLDDGVELKPPDPYEVIRKACDFTSDPHKVVEKRW